MQVGPGCGHAEVDGCDRSDARDSPATDESRARNSPVLVEKVSQLRTDSNLAGADGDDMMVVRLTTKLAKKIGARELESLPCDPNPFADWTAHLFTQSRRQYILIANTHTLYSVVMRGSGLTSPSAFLAAMRDCLAEYLAYDELNAAFNRLILPAMGTITYGKTLNRSVTGSMNDLVHFARCYMADGDLSLMDVSSKLNEAPMSFLEYDSPGAAFGAIALGSSDLESGCAKRVKNPNG